MRGRHRPLPLPATGRTYSSHTTWKKRSCA
ncbi:hypothetical protein CGRA01v4_01805 [Colletotrichum graminicola]|nr:hypothetical protein CGRA01v4_01805 [Colletotrichum graminicola]